MEEKKEKNPAKHAENAQEVAQAMVENMSANMEDPLTFLEEKERMQDEVAKEVIKKRNLQRADKKRTSN
ncbi:MAG: hypothetical protein EU544_00280 [Promethearchaeota archaeon]|nr:MAG: hypothetical protein EU544_00280 [Candidatus Lokiarchaeota archaeon]